MALSKLQILEEMKLKTKTVDLASGPVIVTELSAPDYMAVLNSPLIRDDKDEFDGTKFTALLVARSIVDETGARVFADEDADALRSGSRAVYQKLCHAANNLNGLNEDATKN